ncbi:MAG: glycosyltransferase family 9 protein [Ignavibacteriae bacterium]|nr:glycosyltransferase family 9 protein [Ignavibacteriota bacterium]
MKNIKQHINNLLLNLFYFLFHKKPNKSKINIANKLKVLIIIFEDLKTSLALTPLLKVLNDSFNCEITVLGNVNNQSVFNNNLLINKYSLYNKNIGIVKTFLPISKNKIDIIINPHEKQNVDAALFLGLIKAKYKIGFEKEDHQLLTHILPILDHNRIHIVDRLLSITEAFNKEFNKSELNIFYQPTKTSETLIEEYFIKHDLLHKFTIAVNISNSAELGFWGINNYKNLLKYLKNFNANIIVCASIDDIENAEKISDGKTLIYYDTEFDEFAALLKNVNLIFSPDSYIVQLAAAFKIPVFCLFVQHKTAEMINVPYNSDFDFAVTDNDNLKNISYGNVLNSFVPYIEYIYEKYNSAK